MSGRASAGLGAVISVASIACGRTETEFDLTSGDGAVLVEDTSRADTSTHDDTTNATTSDARDAGDADDFEIGVDATIDAPSDSSDTSVGPDRTHGLFGGYVGAIVVDPFHHGTVYAAPTRVENTSLEKSTDGGATWFRVWRTAGSSIDRLFADPAVEGRLYIVADGRPSRSDDGGATWKILRTDRLADFAWSPTHPSRMYASLATDVCAPGNLSRSDDGGETWSCVHETPTLTGAIAVSPRDPDVLVSYDPSGSALVPLRRSIDGGKTWSIVVGPLGASFGPRARSPLFGFTGGTLFRSDDDGATFRDLVTGFGGPSTFDLGDALVLFVAAAGRQMRSVDEGKTWHETSEKLADLHVVAFDPNEPKTAYAGAGYDVYRTTDTGDHWTNVSSTLKGIDVDDVRTTLADPNRLYAETAKGLYASRDRAGFFAFIAPRPRQWVNAQSNADVLYRREEGDRVLRSGDGGVTWKLVYDDLLTTTNVSGLAVATDDEQRVWIDTRKGLQRSTDGGATWTLLPPVAGLDRAHLQATTKDHLITAGAAGGLFRSSDGGLTWSKTDVASGDLSDLRWSIAGSSHTVYGCATEGLRVTTDDGAHWALVHAGPCEWFAASPSDPQRIYLTDAVHKLWRSEDGGASWTGALTPFWSGEFTVDAADASVLLGYRGADFAWSHDGGRTWTYD